MTTSFFMPLGGGNEIGANSYYLNLHGVGIILDAGMHPTASGLEALPDFSLLQDLPIDHVIITHAHQDHIGALPFLIKKYPYLKIHATPQTVEMIKYALHTALRIMKQQNFEQLVGPLYSHGEIDLLTKSIYEHEYREPFILEGYPHDKHPDVKAAFYDAGHILGSAGILLEQGRRSYFYTGDVNFTDQELQLRADFPKHYIENLITETTLGNTEDELLPAWKAERERFARHASKVLNRNGSLLIPVFAIGKTQEMLTMIHNLMNAGMLTRVPVYTGGMSKKINRLYDRNKHHGSLRPDGDYLRQIPVRSLQSVDAVSAFFKEPCIVLASSGMVMEGTASYRLAPHFLEDSKSSICTVGYMDPDSAGAVIAGAKKGDTIRLSETSAPVKVRCTIERFRFTAHSRREDILGFIQRVKPARVLLVHGEEESVNYMGNAILASMTMTKVHAAEQGKRIMLPAGRET